MKTMAIPKSLEEVWEWKDKCYEESKDLSVKNYLDKVHTNAEKALKESGFIDKDGMLEKIRS